MEHVQSSVPELARPPRGVSAPLAVRLLFGGFASQFGWLFLGFGLIFVRVFDAGSGMAEIVRFRGDLASVEGASTGWRALNLSVNEVTVYETSYAFRLADGTRVAGASYRTGGYVEAGLPVQVEYRADDPRVSRIQGMRESTGGLGLSFVYVFPLIGLIFVLVGIRKGLTAKRLMTRGRLALGRLTGKEPTSTKINEQTVYALTFEFEADGRVYEVVAKSHRPYALEDEPEERLVYDPAHPGDAVMLDELPTRPRITESGDFDVEGTGARALLDLVLPGLTLLGHGSYLLFG